MIPCAPTRLTFHDSFWAPRLQTNRAVTLPHVYAMCQRTGRLAAWEWKPGDPNPPHVFWDSDVAKWMEAASYSLAQHYDAGLDAQLDSLIARMAGAQLADGYLNSHYIAVQPENRWTNLRDKHELYCAGHLMEAAVAHFDATGKRALLDLVCRYADHIDSIFGRQAGKRRGYPGHEEIELALVKLYRATGERRYLRLAQYFVDERGRQPHYFDVEARARGEDPARWHFKTYAYMQAHCPVREQTEVVGHAVRAMYLYSAMADLARELGDDDLRRVCERLWRHLVSRRLYVTGGIGSSASNEGFTRDYDLPEDAYAETCAAIGLIFWSHRMLHLTGDGAYADVLERALYNGALCGVSLDGRRFFYVNPLSSRGEHERQEWYDCACCPPNIARLIAGVGTYFYSLASEAVWVHLYAHSQARLEVGGGEVMLRQTSGYPWDGVVRIGVHPPSPTAFSLHLRVPGWCDDWGVRVNDRPVRAPRERGYVQLSRRWHPGDEVELTLAMPVRAVYANPNVRSAVGRVALQRGPIVYCLESVDNGGAALDCIAVLPSSLTPEHAPGLLGGATVLRGRGRLTDERGWNGDLYRFWPPSASPVEIAAVPYCVWGNRSGGEMKVWLRTADE